MVKDMNFEATYREGKEIGIKMGKLDILELLNNEVQRDWTYMDLLKWINKQIRKVDN